MGGRNEWNTRPGQSDAYRLVSRTRGELQIRRKIVLDRVGGRMVHLDPENGARWRLNSTREKSIPSSKYAQL